MFISLYMSCVIFWSLYLGCSGAGLLSLATTLGAIATGLVGAGRLSRAFKSGNSREVLIAEVVLGARPDVICWLGTLVTYYGLVSAWSFICE